MARFNAKDVDNYGGSGGGGFFTLADDGDMATVRFLYKDVDDIEGFSVHEIDLDGKRRYVNCLREYNEPVDTCPFCARGDRPRAKLFVPLFEYDPDESAIEDNRGTVKIWERGKKFFADLSGICSRYSKYPIVSQLFDVERHGRRGETSTTYAIYRTDDPVDDMTIEDFEMPNVLGGFVLDKTYDEMQYFVQHNKFPSSSAGSGSGKSEPVRRRGHAVEEDVEEVEEDVEEVEEERPVRRSGRRTPAGRKDKF